VSAYEAGIDEFCRECEHKLPDVNMGNVRGFIPGLDRTVPLFDGRTVRYVNLDNAATTPPFQTVVDCVGRFFQWYSSVHRGTGFKSLFSTQAYEHCREVVADFVGADLSYHTLIFVQNATHALNKLAMRVCLPEGGVVLTTLMEHHSNLLPWRRRRCEVHYAGIRRSDGRLDMEDLQDKIKRNSGRLCLVTVTGASNVTGNIPPIRLIARMAHEHGALVAVDATQLVSHRPFKMGAPDDPERIDFAAFSGHKMYAPFGCGVLVGPRRVFEQGDPDMVGGGTIHMVTMEDAIWADPPEREEAGTPNVVGGIALGVAVRTLASIGMENLAEHERKLTRRALRKLRRIDGLTLYGETDPDFQQDRIGVIAMNARSLSHGQLAAILGYEWGIGVRNGCFCAQPYVRELLGIPEERARESLRKLATGDPTAVPGMVRMSLGVYNTEEDVDLFVEAVRRVLKDGPRAHYVVDERNADYVPEPLAFDISRYAAF
jgi:selenocysteine lyase/cysteine desulfurase